MFELLRILNAAKVALLANLIKVVNEVQVIKNPKWSDE